MSSALARGLALVLLLAGCTSDTASRTPEPKVVGPKTLTQTAPAAPTPAPAVPKIAEAHRCATPSDCTASCRHGAVNRRWWETTYPGGESCEGGCADKAAETPTCVEGACQAMRQGKADPRCTKLSVAPIPGPGWAHRCAKEDSCMLSCTWGAVNKAWYATLTQQECKGGCTAKGMSVRCHHGSCQAMRDGAVYQGCTLRSIHAIP